MLLEIYPSAKYVSLFFTTKRRHCFFFLFALSLSLDSINYFRQAYVQMFFVLHLVTAMSKRENYSLPFVPELVRPGLYTIYVVSFLAVPEKKIGRSIRN